MMARVTGPTNTIAFAAVADVRGFGGIIREVPEDQCNILRALSPEETSNHLPLIQRLTQHLDPKKADVGPAPRRR